MDSIIKPTIGRKVWFFPAAADIRTLENMGTGHFWKHGEQPMDATIVYVHDDHKVNLAIFDHAGLHHVWPSVYLVQPGDAQDPGPLRHCRWMPYQKGQAANHDAAAKEWRTLEPRPSVSEIEELVNNRGGSNVYIDTSGDEVRVRGDGWLPSGSRLL